MKKQIVTGLATVLIATTPVKADMWGNIQAGYSPQIGQTTRVEAGSDHAYGFMDVTGGNKYGELRVTKDIGKFGIVAEYNGGDNVEDTVRFGATYTTSLSKGNFTIFKVLPVDTADKGTQISIYSSQELTDKLTGSVLVDENIGVGTFIEADLTYKLKGDISIYGRVADFEGDTTSSIGLRYDF